MSSGRVARPLRQELVGSVTTLAASIACVPPPPVARQDATTPGGEAKAKDGKAKGKAKGKKSGKKKGKKH